jgi:hypothetical protein
VEGLNMGESWIGIPNSFLVFGLLFVVGAYVTHLSSKIAELQAELDNLKWDVANSVQGFYHHMSEPHPDKKK